VELLKGFPKEKGLLTEAGAITGRDRGGLGLLEEEEEDGLVEATARLGARFEGERGGILWP
jgi:hypothetical protein